MRTATQSILVLAGLALGLAAVPDVAHPQADNAATQTALPDPATGAEPAAPAMDANAEIDQINAYINSISTISGKFVQTVNGRNPLTGQFYWKRPDQLRIEYDTSPLLIIADGTNIAQIDKKLETIDQVRIGWTPYKFLLAKNFDLRKGAELVGISKADGETRVTLKDPEGKIDGEFTLVFSNVPSLQFQGWTWNNAYDGQVDFRLQDTQTGKRLNRNLFVIRESERRGGSRNR